MEIPQLQHLLDSVAAKFGHALATSNDFEILSLDIERETGELLSASTLKRLWGYVSLHPVPRVATLNVLARYLGFRSFQDFCLSLVSREGEPSSFFGASCISAKDLKEGERIRLGWAPDRLVELLYRGHFEFEVVEAVNTKLCRGDRFELSDIIQGCPLYISCILRDGKYTRPYMAAVKDGLNRVEKC